MIFFTFRVDLVKIHGTTTIGYNHQQFLCLSDFHNWYRVKERMRERWVSSPSVQSSKCLQYPLPLLSLPPVFTKAGRSGLRGHKKQNSGTITSHYGGHRRHQPGSGRQQNYVIRTARRPTWHRYRWHAITGIWAAVVCLKVTIDCPECEAHQTFVFVICCVSATGEC